MEKFKLPIALFAVGFVLIIGGIFLNTPKTSKGKVYPQESLVSEKLIRVDVSGAVNKPGVYQLKDGSRIEDVVKAAEGFTQDANQEYISKTLNMAQKLSDGTKVYIPFEGEQGTVSAGSSVNAKININTATQAELETLPGIGVTTASAIISDRPYQTIEDLLNKKIVKKTVFEKIKEQLVVY